MAKNRDGISFLAIGGTIFGLYAARKLTLMHKASQSGDDMVQLLHTTRYRTPDDKLVAGRANAIVLKPSDIVSAVEPFTYLAPGFFVGVSERETNFALNQEDVDYNPGGTIRKKTYGPYQSDDPSASTSLEKASRQFAHDAENIVKAIAIAGKFDPLHPPKQAYAYAAWGHNQGAQGGPVASINKYGMDWVETIRRNQDEYNKTKSISSTYMVEKMIPYANVVLKYVDIYPAKLKAV